MKKEIKLIALDLDDTFLDDDKGIPKENELAVQEAIAKGVYVVVSTGRSLTAIPMEDINRMGVQYAITANGAEIHQQRGNEQRRRYDGIVEQEGNHREDQHQQQLHPAVAQMKKGSSGVVKRYTLHGTAPFIAATSPAAWEQV